MIIANTILLGRSAGGSGKVIYMGEDHALASGALGLGSNLDYIMGVHEIIDDEGYSQVYGQIGLGHNVQPNHIIRWKETAPGSGVYNAYEIITDGTVRWFSNPRVIYTSTGRIVLLYVELIGGAGARIVYRKYSDDNGATWSSEALAFPVEQGTGGQFEDKQMNAGPGSWFEYDGKIWFPLYATPTLGITRGIYIASSVDNGDTFQLVKTVITPANDDNWEEPTGLLHFVNGQPRMIVYLRTDTHKTIWITYSDNFTLNNSSMTFSTPVDTGIPAINTINCVKTDNNTIFLFTREPASFGNGLPPIYAYSKAVDGISGYQGPFYLDVHREDQEQEGGVPIWKGDHISLKYCVPGLDTTYKQGPTLLISKKIYDTPVVEPTVYNKYTKDWLSFAQGLAFLGNIKPDSDAMALLDTFITERAIANGWYSELDAFWIFSSHLNANLIPSAFSRPWRWRGSYINSPTVSADGIDFNGTTQAFNTGIIPNLATKFTQNSACMFVTITEDVQADAWMGCSNANASSFRKGPAFNPRSSLNQARYFINDNTITNVANSNSIGRWLLQRPDSATKKLFKDGVEFHSASVASQTKTDQSQVHFGAIRFANQLGFYNTRKVFIGGLGASLSGGEAEFDSDIAWLQSQMALL